YATSWRSDRKSLKLRQPSIILGLSMKTVRGYSPTQVAVSSFLGGPLATVYVLWRNFLSLGDSSAAAKTAIWGILMVLAFILVLPFIPDNIPIPRVVIPAAYTAMATSVAQKYQLTKEAIA